VSTRAPYETSPLLTEPRSFSERLRWLRKQAAMTQVEVSQALGCDQAMVSSWEVGRTRPSSVALGTLARYYGVSIRALETGEGFQSEAEAARSARMNALGEGGPMDQCLPVDLQPVTPGTLRLVDLEQGTQDFLDTAEAMAALLGALKKGRKAWVVVK